MRLGPTIKLLRGEGGGMGDLICVRIFSQTSGERIFSSIIHQEIIFFSVKEFFSPVLIFFQDFFPRNQSAGYIFSEITHPPPLQ